MFEGRNIPAIYYNSIQIFRYIAQKWRIIINNRENVNDTEEKCYLSRYTVDPSEIW